MEFLSDEWNIRVRVSCARCFIDLGVRAVGIETDRPSVDAGVNTQVVREVSAGLLLSASHRCNSNAVGFNA